MGGTLLIPSHKTESIFGTPAGSLPARAFHVARIPPTSLAARPTTPHYVISRTITTAPPPELDSAQRGSLVEQPRRDSTPRTSKFVLRLILSLLTCLRAASHSRQPPRRVRITGQMCASYPDCFRLFSLINGFLRL